MTDRDAKLEFIDAYFGDIDARLHRLDTIAAQELLEEAIILACCYLNGLARDRFALPGSRDDTKIFTDFVRRYGGHPEIFGKISRREITHRSANDPFPPKQLHQHETVITAILARFGDSTKVTEDPTDTELLEVLSGIPRLDFNNLQLNLWRYTYGAVLYRRWRNSGVHQGQVGNRTNLEGEKVYPKGDDGADVYYDTFGQLTFSAEFLLEILRTAARSLREECMQNALFPHELFAMDREDTEQRRRT